MNKYTKTLLQERRHGIILKTMKYTDAHCHITTPLCPPDIIGRICNATTEVDWQKLTEIANKQTHICIGIHPWHIQTAVNGWDDRMRKILQSNPHVMVGEIGLDKYYLDIDRQIDFFTKQLRIAIELNRPVHLHIVGTWDKILHILKNHKNLPLIVVHAFNGNNDIMGALAEYNAYFSYKLQNSHISDTARTTPIDKILVESDCDTCAEQIQILTATTQEIAKMRCTPAKELNEQINKNFQRVINYA